jgi:hypothetical protein
LVNIHPNITSFGSKKELPKLSIAALLISILLPDKFTVFIFKSLLPIDWPKYIQNMSNIHDFLGLLQQLGATMENGKTS